jgi:hypothetical protein
MLALLGCTRDTLWAAIDYLACQVLYRRPVPDAAPLFVALSRFSFSERAEMEMRAANLPKFDRPLVRVPIADRGGRPCVEVAVPDGGFICEIPGFVCNFSEMQASAGLSLQWLSIPRTEFVIDTDQTSFTLCSRIRRSFHFNSEPWLVKIHGEIKVVLLGHRLRSPVADPAAKRATAIAEGGELVLPLDADVPFPVPQVEWKEKRAKHRTVQISAQAKQPDKKKGDRPTEKISLLALFYDPSVPPLHIQLLSSEEMTEKAKAEAIRASSRILTRNRLRTRDD